MKNIPPILKPLAVLTISTLVATATSVINSSSYRPPSGQEIKSTETVDRIDDSTTQMESSDEKKTTSTSEAEKKTKNAGTETIDTTMPSETEQNEPEETTKESIPDIEGSQETESSDHLEPAQEQVPEAHSESGSLESKPKERSEETKAAR